MSEVHQVPLVLMRMFKHLKLLFEINFSINLQELLFIPIHPFRDKFRVLCFRNGYIEFKKVFSRILQQKIVNIFCLHFYRLTLL